MRESINGNIHVLVAPMHFEPAIYDIADDTDLLPTYNIFSAFPDTTPKQPDILLHAFPAVDSKADTLTHSQILFDADTLEFICAQAPEIDGLLKMRVFDIKRLLEKPPKAQFLTSIWSYHCKRSPMGKILK